MQAQRLITQGYSAIAENTILFFALMAASDAFNLEKKVLLSEINKLKDKIASWQNSESTAKFAELRRTYDDDEGALKEML